jgi:hypothetical protein
LSNALLEANAASLVAVHKQIEKARLRWDTRLATEWERETGRDGRPKHARTEKENDVEKVVKKVIFHDMKYDCVHEMYFPLRDTRNRKGEFISRSRSPDFVLSHMKVDGKYIDMDPHHFCPDEEGKAEKSQVERWVEFKRMWGNNFYIVFISHNTEKEVEELTGTCVDAFCDAFLHVGKRKEKTEDEMRRIVRDFLKGLTERSITQGGFSCKHSDKEDDEFLEILNRAERGRSMQMLMNTTKADCGPALEFLRR